MEQVGDFIPAIEGSKCGLSSDNFTISSCLRLPIGLKLLNNLTY